MMPQYDPQPEPTPDLGGNAPNILNPQYGKYKPPTIDELQNKPSSSQPSSTASSKPDDVLKRFGNIPSPDLGLYKNIAGVQENQAKTQYQQNQKEQEALYGDKGLFQKQSQTIQDQLNLNNEQYKQWVSNNDKSKDALNEVQSKYPMLSRQDVINNMSTGHKLVSAALVMLGSGRGDTPIDQNPAWHAFNQSLDDVVTSNKIGYEREHQNIMQTKLFNDQTFSTAMAKSQSDADIKLNLLKNNAALVASQARKLTPEEQAQQSQNTATMASAATKQAADQLRVNTQMQLYNLKMQQSQLEAAARGKYQEEHMRTVVPTVQTDSRGNTLTDQQGNPIIKDQVEDMFISPSLRGEAAKKSQESYEISSILNKVGIAIDRRDSDTAKILSQELKDKHGVELPPDTWKISFWKTGLMDAKAAINDMRVKYANSGRDYLQSSSFAPLPQQK
jgi:hypothetical protein